MNIKILGTGCPKCKKLAKIVEKIIKENDIDADIEKITDMKDIMSYNVMMTPALVIDEEVKSTGQIPKKDKILEWLK